MPDRRSSMPIGPTTAGPDEPPDRAGHHYLEWEFGEFDVAAFRRAWRALLERHPVLRAADPRGTAGLAPAHREVRVLDLRAAEASQARRRIRAERARMVMRAPRGPLPCDVLVTLLPGERTHLHLAADPAVVGRWTLTHVLLPDLARLTADPDDSASCDATARARGLSDETPDTPGSPRPERTSEPAPPPALPVIAARNPTGPHTLRRTSRSTPADTWGRLAEAARAYGVAADEAIAAAFAEVLRTWSTSERFAFTHLSVDAGDVVASLLEMDAAGRTFADRARAVRRGPAGGPDHPSAAGTGRAQHPGHGALSSSVVLATLLHRPGSAAFGPPAVAHSPEHEALLTVEVTRDERGALELVWHWPADRYPPGMSEAMADALRQLLERLGANGPEWTSEHLRLVPEEQLALRARVNATGTPLPTGLLHTPVVEQARLRPHALAVITTRRTLSYRELNSRMNQVGRRLRELGARPGHLVAVVMEKGWEQIVGLHGVLVSGAAYVPIDPTVPAERLHRLLHDAEAGLVLTQSRIDTTVRWPDDVLRLSVDTDFDGVDDGPLEQAQQQTDLAYVIFTSGSTGTPKGVMVDHRGALNALHDVNRRMGMGPGDRCLALSGLPFDLSVYDTFGLTAVGAAVVIPDPSPYPDPGHWARLMDEADVTFVLAVAALLEMLTTYVELDGGRERISSLRTVIQAGDVLPTTLPDRLRALNPRVRMFNAGGPAESCVLSVIHAVDRVDPAATSIPIGRPMANQRYHVLDERFQPRPVWVPGEIHITGDVGLAQGYWRDEERSAAHFRPVPGIGERVYATGDMARYLPNGDLEILGRKDFQVKIQGVRIELGEIEATLAEHPTVASAVIVADRTVPDLPVLRAYVVPREGGRAASPDELRAFLARKLPSSMVPAGVTVLDRLPLNANGKVDRLALTSRPGAGSVEPFSSRWGL